MQRSTTITAVVAVIACIGTGALVEHVERRLWLDFERDAVVGCDASAVELDSRGGHAGRLTRAVALKYKLLAEIPAFGWKGEHVGGDFREWIEEMPLDEHP